MKIAILTTGGTIEKTYDEVTGALGNQRSVLEQILHSLRIPMVEVRHVRVMSKDSSDMTDADRHTIRANVETALITDDAVVVVHGTDTLAETGRLLHTALRGLTKPVILTGAMRPFEFRDTDAFQNVTEALLAARLLAPGVYCVMHSQALVFPGVAKDVEKRTFVSASREAAVR